MAVKIRLRRMGHNDPSTYNVNEELAKKWLASGAQPTEVVSKIFKLAGIEK